MKIKSLYQNEVLAAVGRARHSVRAGLWLAPNGAHGVARPTANGHFDTRSKSLLCLALLNLCHSSHAHGPLYDGFAYPPGPLIGNGGWFGICQPGPEQPIVIPGLLQTQCMEPAITNRVEINAGNGCSAFLPFSVPGVSGVTNSGDFANGIIFFSFALRVPDLGALNTNGHYFCGIVSNHPPALTTNMPFSEQTFVQVWLRSTGDGQYQVGLKKSGHTTSPAWETGTHSTNDTVLIVGMYGFIPAAADGAALWVNPEPTNFCATIPPAPLLYDTTLPDATSLASFMLLQTNSPYLPASILFDELHIADEWPEVVAPGCDFGDAPDTPYRTLTARNGARHQIVTNIFLGAKVDAECDGQPNSTATGDDIAGEDDERNGSSVRKLVRGLPTPFKVTASVAGRLNVWVDWNQNGIWDNPSERISSALGIPLVAGENTVNITAPTDAPLGTNFVRFRFSTAGNLTPVGLAADGEVVDFRVNVKSEPTTLAISMLNQGLVISWDYAGEILEKAPTPQGPWTPIIGATSPFVIGVSNVISEPAGFFRCLDTGDWIQN